MLALILLIGLGFVIYLKNSGLKHVEIEKISRLPFDFDSIKPYVESCIESIGKDGVSNCAASFSLRV